MPLITTHFIVSTHKHGNCRAKLITRPCGGRDIYICVADIDHFLSEKYLHRIEYQESAFAPWETLQDESTKLMYYHLTAIPYMLPMDHRTAEAREGLIKIIQAASKTAETIKP